MRKPLGIQKCDGSTDRPTDLPTDTARCRVACPRLKILYHSFIQPHIMYGLPVWGGCNAQNSKRIVAIQKRAIRTITKSFFSAHTEPRMKKLGLLKFSDLYEQQCLTLAHDCYYHRAPTKISSFLNGCSNLQMRILRKYYIPIEPKEQ